MSKKDGRIKFGGLNTRPHPSKIASGEATDISGMRPIIDGTLQRRVGYTQTTNKTTATTVALNGIALFEAAGQETGYLVSIGTDGKSRRCDA